MGCYMQFRLTLDPRHYALETPSRWVEAIAPGVFKLSNFYNVILSTPTIPLPQGRPRLRSYDALAAEILTSDGWMEVSPDAIPGKSVSSRQVRLLNIMRSRGVQIQTTRRSDKLYVRLIPKEVS